MSRVRRNRGASTVAGSTRTSVNVLLTEDVESLGGQGEIVRVKPGYARNYLLPHGLATVATEAGRRMVERHRKRVIELKKGRIRNFRKLAEAVNKYSVTLEANAGKDGRLYGSVVDRDISRALQSSGFDVQPENVRLEGPLKELGMYTVRVHFHEEVETDLKVWVVPSSDSGS